MCRWRSITPIARRRPSRVRRPLPCDQAAVFANQQIEMLALLVGELEEDALAFRLLEALAVRLEEAVRSALAADADEQRLAVAAALLELLGARREQAVGGALEEEERRLRLERRIGGDAAPDNASSSLRKCSTLFGGELARTPCGRAHPSPAARRACRTRGRCARSQSRCAARRARRRPRSASAAARPRGRSGSSRTSP